uniref:Uncharacterized protein n=1 Tax=Setaria italica TaxID=4555 RepID=K3ZPR0_SETIT
MSIFCNIITLLTQDDRTGGIGYLQTSLMNN